MNHNEGMINLLVNYFKESEFREEERKLGLEVEHFILEGESLKATTYYQQNGIEDLLRVLGTRSWEPKTEKGHVVGLEGEDCRVALEPGGQLEVSILPQDTIKDLEDIYLEFIREVISILNDWGKELFCLGYQPKSLTNEIPLLPKERYKYMYEYFKDKGKYAHHMMKATAAIHVNLDYHSEKDYIKKNLVANVLSPLIYTVVDNSPFFEGEVSGEEGLRRTIWENCDSDRCGLPVDLFSGRFGYREYAEYLLNTPPLVYKKDGELVYSKDKLLKNIIPEKLNPDGEELEYLLTTVFPDVRTKNHLEIRMGDSLPYPYSLGYLAFWKGLLYSEENLNDLYGEFKELSREDFFDRKRRLAENGLEARWDSRSVFSAYRDLVESAARGLGSRDREYLTPLMELAEQEVTPSRKTLELFSKSKKKALSWCNLNEVVKKEE